MEYEFDSQTIKWAKKRCNDLLSGEVNLSSALERAQYALLSINETADQMNDQPESEMIRHYTRAIEKSLKGLDEILSDIKRDRTEIGKGVVRYGEHS